MNECDVWVVAAPSWDRSGGSLFPRVGPVYGFNDLNVLIGGDVTSFSFLIKCAYLATVHNASKRLKQHPLCTYTRTPRLQSTPPVKGRRLTSRPQVKGIVTRVRTMSPKKPNSAVRHVAKVNLSNALRVTTRLPGIGYLCSKYNRVLVEGGRANDLPGVGYTLIRGAYDFSPVIYKKKRRSVYGVSRPEGHTKYVRKCLRHQM